MHGCEGGRTCRTSSGVAVAIEPVSLVHGGEHERRRMVRVAHDLDSTARIVSAAATWTFSPVPGLRA